jgi:hypothetical protein
MKREGWLPVLERYFRKKKGEEEECMLLLVRKIAIIYTQLPNGPKSHRDGPASATTKMTSLDLLSHSDNSYLLLNGEEEQELLVQVDARGGENWVGFAVNGRRVKFLQQDEKLTLTYDRKTHKGWESIYKQEIEWTSIQEAVEFIEREILPTV